MKKTKIDVLLEEQGFHLYLFKQLEHIVEYINSNTGMEIRFNLLSKSVRLKKHLHGQDSDFECNQIILDLINSKMLELLQGGK